MANLLARLNTHESLNAVSAEGKKYGAGIYVDFGDESEIYKQGTFKKVIDSMLDQAIESDEPNYNDIARDVKNALSQQEAATRCDILVYDPKNEQFLRNITNEESIVMDMDDFVKGYIVERQPVGSEETYPVDYLDIVVKLNSSVGRK